MQKDVKNSYHRLRSSCDNIMVYLILYITLYFLSYPPPLSSVYIFFLSILPSLFSSLFNFFNLIYIPFFGPPAPPMNSDHSIPPLYGMRSIVLVRIHGLRDIALEDNPLVSIYQFFSNWYIPIQMCSGHHICHTSLQSSTVVYFYILVIYWIIFYNIFFWKRLHIWSSSTSYMHNSSGSP